MGSLENSWEGVYVVVEMEGWGVEGRLFWGGSVVEHLGVEGRLGWKV